MLKLIQTEFLKLRRKKFIWLMLLAAFFMPFFALLYFIYFGKKGADPVLFYKWSSFGYTLFIILPFVLGMLSTVLMHAENKNDMLKQLFIVPISKMGYFFSKFFVVLIFSICFMLINAVATVLLSVLSGSVIFDWESILFLLKKCLEIGFIAAFAMLPILAIATTRKGYILPICITLVYTFFGFFMTSVNMYLHPLSSMSVIIVRNRDIPDILFTQAINVPLAILSICVWDVAAILAENVLLRRK